MKVCRVCGGNKSLDDYYVRERLPSGAALYIDSVCKACKKEYQKNWKRTTRGRRAKARYAREANASKKLQREERITDLQRGLENEGWDVTRIYATGRCAGTTTRLVCKRGGEHRTIRLAWRNTPDNLPKEGRGESI